MDKHFAIPIAPSDSMKFPLNWEKKKYIIKKKKLKNL
jgi:hypothetical protein